LVILCFDFQGLPSVETTMNPPKNDSSNGAADHNNRNSSLNLNMTAKELRAKLASRKKYDPKKESMDFKKKFDIVQKLWNVFALYAFFMNKTTSFE